ncbi:uncharacterized protein [Cicer arietinum]|uniref:Uncharacterized protein LOC113786777 isoform X2 n=1 Tax=Cicer arietinum TaxID=3827 RepID=A0A3Q7YBZ1_CICAR|nr:uncharacterized protein LOC113786777 isoform X2 [Cicer arietinum]
MKRSCLVYNDHKDEDKDDVKKMNFDEVHIPELTHKRCNICGKTFSSGKALGGHRRSHFQASKKKHHSQNNKEDQDDDDDGNYCSLPRWKNRDKRGRKCIGGVEAAKNLLHLHLNIFNLSIDIEPKSPPHQFPIPSKNRDFYISESSSNRNGEMEEHVVNKIKFFYGSSLKIGNKSDIENGGESDNNEKEINISKSLLFESRVDESSSNRSAEQKILNFDLNEPYVMED